ncbi:MAG: glycosyltransferase [Candidatus Azobacteroides sp.]|nr:glycosyltransferase [Candidatus Azobacteroides sp.]
MFIKISVENKIIFLQPFIPHYREEFFQLLGEKVDRDIYVYESSPTKLKYFQQSNINVKNIGNIQWKGFLIYNPIPFLSGKYDTIVLMWHFGHITTWLLLLTKFIHRKKMILFGQGISVKRYLKEEIKPDWKLKYQLKLADGAWVYMEKEQKQWARIFPRKPIEALNNTISNISEIVQTEIAATDKNKNKKKYGITQRRILLFCARFENPYRRVDLLIETIKRLPSDEFGVIIIGAGVFKPDFGEYPNVYDFGTVYDNQIKYELFSIADIYFQPGWVGLSIVEAMAYSLPVFTFKRTDEIKQCVEYSYISDKENGMLFNNMEECLQVLQNITDDEINAMGNNARQMVKEKLSVSSMVNNALNIFV